jgi:hypothetical protein
MRAAKILIAATLSALLLLTVNCATPGAPLPPSLNLPRPVEDLVAVRHGSRVVLSWSQPLQTTDHLNIRHYGLTRLCRSLRSYPMPRCEEIVRQLALEPQRAADGTLRTRVTMEDSLSPSAQLDATGMATYAVEVLNPSQRSAGLSNQVRVPLAPTLPAPAAVTAKVQPDGVHLGWRSAPREATPQNLRFRYRVLRSPAGKQSFAAIGELPWQPGEMNYTDGTAQWEDSYLYQLLPLTLLPGANPPQEIAGEAAEPVSVTVHDIFPPAQPKGVQAVFSGTGQKPFIDLTWEPNMESDLAGYIVFRHKEGAAPTRLNPALTAVPSFRDEKVLPGETYFYTVQAVDTQGNLSTVSSETSESVPED